MKATFRSLVICLLGLALANASPVPQPGDLGARLAPATRQLGLGTAVNDALSGASAAATEFEEFLEDYEYAVLPNPGLPKVENYKRQESPSPAEVVELGIRLATRQLGLDTAVNDVLSGVSAAATEFKQFFDEFGYSIIPYKGVPPAAGKPLTDPDP